MNDCMKDRNIRHNYFVPSASLAPVMPAGEPIWSKGRRTGLDLAPLEHSMGLLTMIGRHSGDRTGFVHGMRDGSWEVCHVIPVKYFRSPTHHLDEVEQP